jgi:hypothetical protein
MTFEARQTSYRASKHMDTKKLMTLSRGLFDVAENTGANTEASN